MSMGVGRPRAEKTRERFMGRPGCARSGAARAPPRQPGESSDALTLLTSLTRHHSHPPILFFVLASQ